MLRHFWLVHRKNDRTLFEFYAGKVIWYCERDRRGSDAVDNEAVTTGHFVLRSDASMEAVDAIWEQSLLKN